MGNTLLINWCKLFCSAPGIFVEAACGSLMHCCQANQRLKRPTGGTDTLLLKRRFLLLPCFTILCLLTAYYLLLLLRFLVRRAFSRHTLLKERACAIHWPRWKVARHHLMVASLLGHHDQVEHPQESYHTPKGREATMYTRRVGKPSAG